MKKIKFENVTKKFGNNTILDNLNLEVKPGERLILLGPSGCGKSTLLRLIAGLTESTSGNIYFGDENINNVSAGDRNVSFVFQNYALYPHMSVEKNVTYALQAHKIDKKEIEDRKEEALTMLGLKGYEKRKPKELSGGQRQRVALARAVVKRSEFFLLDEPLSNLDAQLRHHARKELLKIHEAYGQTFVYVTHDQVEAMTLGDRVALLNGGKIQQLDTPENIFNRPANVFTAKFIGSPSCNLIECDYDLGQMKLSGQTIDVPRSWMAHIEKSEINSLTLGLRPEHVILSQTRSENSIEVTISSIENFGSQKGYYFNIGDFEWVAMSDSNTFKVGDKAYFDVNYGKMHLFERSSQNSIGYPERKVS